MRLYLVMTLEHRQGSSAARPVAALVGALLLVATTLAPPAAAAATTGSTASRTSPAAPTSTREAHAEELAVRLVAAARSRAGLPPIRSSAGAETAARARAVDMRDRGYFAHVSPDGTDVFDLLDRSGLPWTAASEAIGWNTVAAADDSAERVVEDWLASPGHRGILLAGDLDAIGLASAADAATGRRIWVAVLVAVPAPVPPAVSVRIERVGRPDAAGVRAVVISWRPRASPAGRAPVASVTVQVRRTAGTWATAFVAAVRTTIRLRVRAPGAFEVRVRARAPGGTTGQWTVVRFRP